MSPFCTQGTHVPSSGSFLTKYLAYKWCFVNECHNSTTKTPDTIFFPVPAKPIERNKWFESAQRRDMPGNSNMFCCQDHFDVSIVSSCS